MHSYFISTCFILTLTGFSFKLYSCFHPACSPSAFILQGWTHCTFFSLLNYFPFPWLAWMSLLSVVLACLATSGSAEKSKEQVNIPDYWNFMAMVIFHCGFSSKLWVYFSLSWKYWAKNAGLDLRVGSRFAADVWWRLRTPKKGYLS